MNKQYTALLLVSVTEIICHVAFAEDKNHDEHSKQNTECFY